MSTPPHPPHHLQASASIYHNYDQPVYNQRSHVAPFPPNSYGPLHTATAQMHRRTPSHLTSSTNSECWESPVSQSSDWHFQWTPPIPQRRFDTPPKMLHGEATPLSPNVKVPLTPEWFPNELQDTFPSRRLTPPLNPYNTPREPSPTFDPFSSAKLTHWTSPRNRGSLLLRSERSSPVDRAVTTPELPLDFPATRNLSINVIIPKKVMEAKLLQQPNSSTPLCEIVKEGQLCHLRRYERAGVFVRSTVKFDKAFKHLSGLHDNLQHLVIGLKCVPTVYTVDMVTDDAVVSLFQSLPALVEARLHGFTKLTKRSFDAALMYCSNLRVLAITGTRVPGPEPRKVVFSNGRPQYAGGTGSLGPDTLRSLIPFDGPLRDVSLTGRNLRFIDLSFQNIDDMLAREVTALPGRYGNLVIMRELQTTTERYFAGTLEVSPFVDGSRLHGNLRPINPVASTIGWPAA